MKASEIKEGLLNVLVEKEEETEDGISVAVYYNILTDKEYRLNGKADEYFMLGMDVVFDFLEFAEKEATSND